MCVCWIFCRKAWVVWLKVCSSVVAGCYLTASCHCGRGLIWARTVQQLRKDTEQDVVPLWLCTEIKQWILEGYPPQVLECVCKKMLIICFVFWCPLQSGSLTHSHINAGTSLYIQMHLENYGISEISILLYSKAPACQQGLHGASKCITQKSSGSISVCFHFLERSLICRTSTAVCWRIRCRWARHTFQFNPWFQPSANNTGLHKCFIRTNCNRSKAEIDGTVLPLGFWEHMAFHLESRCCSIKKKNGKKKKHAS